MPKPVGYFLRFLFSLAAAYTTYLNLNQILRPELVAHDSEHPAEDFFEPSNQLHLFILIPMLISTFFRAYNFATKPLTEGAEHTDLHEPFLDEAQSTPTKLSTAKITWSIFLNTSSFLENIITLTNSNQVFLHAAFVMFSSTLTPSTARNAALIAALPITLLEAYLEAFAENAITVDGVTDGKASWMTKFHQIHKDNRFDSTLTYMGVVAHAYRHGTGIAAAIASSSMQANRLLYQRLITTVGVGAGIISTWSIIGPTAAFESNSKDVEKNNKDKWVANQLANQNSFPLTTTKLWISGITHGIEMSLPNVTMAVHSHDKTAIMTSSVAAFFIATLGSGVNMATEGLEAAEDYAEIYDEKFGKIAGRDTKALVLWGACAGNKAEVGSTHPGTGSTHTPPPV